MDETGTHYTEWSKPEKWCILKLQVNQKYTDQY